MLKPAYRRTILALAACSALLITLVASAATWDEGKLVVSYFDDGITFHEGEEVDYIWVKEGFSLDGHTLQFVQWPEHEFLGEKALGARRERPSPGPPDDR